MKSHLWHICAVEMLVLTMVLAVWGCGDDITDPSPAGTITIHQAPDSLMGAGWSLTGPQTETGSGDTTFTGMPEGEYTLVWNDVSAYDTPLDSMQTLAAGGAIVFSGRYTVNAGNFVLIHAGTFAMGSPEGELGRFNQETQHEVTLTRDYYISSCEVTEQLWDQVMGDGASTSRKPKTHLSWNEAVEFCNALSLRNGLTPAYEGSGTDWTWSQDTNGYRLPTEAEWEYACRAGSTTAFANGDLTAMNCELDPNLNDMGWYCYNSGNQAIEIGQKLANNWGLYDMHGNVYEYCWDWYGSYPGTATDPVGQPTGSYRVSRGGCWYTSARLCRSATRNSSTPGGQVPGGGFRLAASQRPPGT